MKKILAIICLFSITQCVYADENLKLVFALDLVRHGDRAPDKYNPMISNAWTKEETGKITKRGIAGAKLLGKEFRKYYVDKAHLLPKIFQPELVHVRSTDFQRTKETAKSILQGFYSISSSKVTVVVPLAKQDILNPVSYKQDRALINAKVRKDVSNSNKLLSHEMKRQFEDINHVFGTKLSEAHDMIKLSDLIKVNELHNKPLLKPMSKKTKKNIVSLGDELMLKFFSHPKASCLYAKKFIFHVAELLQSKHKQKYFLYVAHDANLMAITSLLNFNLKKAPQYLSDLRFEMFKDKNQKLFVRMSLDGKVMKLCESLSQCPLGEFVKKLQNNVVNKCNVPA